MQITRRTFMEHLTKGAAATALAAGSIDLSGCSWSSVENDIKNWVPVALTSLASIVKILGPIVPAPVAAIIATIQAGFSALLTAVNNYQAGTGVLSDISNAMTAIENAFQSFFASLNVPSNLLNIVEGLAGILLSTLQAFAAKINPVTPPAASIRVAGRSVTYSAKWRSVKQYRADWNKMCMQNGHPGARI